MQPLGFGLEGTVLTVPGLCGRCHNRIYRKATGAHCALLRDCGPIFNPCAHAHTFQLLTPTS